MVGHRPSRVNPSSSVSTVWSTASRTAASELCSTAAGRGHRSPAAGWLVDDNSVRPHSSRTTDLRLSRRLGADTELTLDVFGLFDRRVNDIEPCYASQLPGEPATVADRQGHPAEPRTLRVTLRTSFPSQGAAMSCSATRSARS
jgi:hypothetical protein